MVANTTVVVADLEAGIGTLTRLAEAAVDVTVVVVEPMPRSIDVGQRAVAVALAQRQGRVVVVANKVVDADDRRRIEAAFPDQEVVVVPADAVIEAADRSGVSPIDRNAGSPAVLALGTLAELIAPESG